MPPLATIVPMARWTPASSSYFHHTVSESESASLSRYEHDLIGVSGMRADVESDEETPGIRRARIIGTAVGWFWIIAFTVAALLLFLSWLSYVNRAPAP